LCLKIPRGLLEIARSAFAAVALVAGGEVLQLSFGEDGFHLDLPAAGTEKLLRSDIHASVLADFGHLFLLSSLSFAIEAWMSAAVDYPPANRIHCVKNQMKYTDFTEKIKSLDCEKSGS
jgi:hypothetical protein